MEHKSMQAVLQQGPCQETDWEKPQQITGLAVRFSEGREVNESSCNYWKNPEGAKSIQPLFQAHTHILTR